MSIYCYIYNLCCGTDDTHIYPHPWSPASISLPFLCPSFNMAISGSQVPKTNPSHKEPRELVSTHLHGGCRPSDTGQIQLKGKLARPLILLTGASDVLGSPGVQAVPKNHTLPDPVWHKQTRSAYNLFPLC